MKLKRIMASMLAICMVLSTIYPVAFAAPSSVVVVETTDEFVENVASQTGEVEAEKTASLQGDYVAKIGNVEYANATEVISALNAASGEVTVEIYGKLETGGFGLNNSNITKLSFVAESDDAEICVDGVSYIDVRNTNYPIEYTGLTLSHINAGQNIEGFLPQYFSTYNGGNVTYTECTFPNGVTACGSVADTTYTFTKCIFNNTTSGLYSLWIYGNSTNVVVNGGEFCGVRGIKMYSEGSDDFSSLSVSGATFFDTITEKHAVVLTKGESITLTDNTFNNTTGIVQIANDSPASINGKTVTIDGTEYIVDRDNFTLEEVTPAEPEVIEIYDWEDLKELDARVESGDMLEGVTVKLMNDINLYEMGEGGEPVTFNPIGANKAYFKGTFDGQGHSIKNMYQSGWALGYDWYNYGSIGLFAYLWNATVKDLTIENAECLVEGGNVAAIAGSAWGDCTFENITVKNSTFATYNNRAAGIVGYTGGEGTMTFKDITVDENTVIAGLWGSFDSSLGGLIGSIQDPTKIVIEDTTVKCRLDAYNDCTAAYKYYAYRMCGMLIGKMPVDSDNKPVLDNVSIANVEVEFDKWANYTYVRNGTDNENWKRVEAGYAYDGVDLSTYADPDYNSITFESLFGGQQYGSYGQSEHEDVEVTYAYVAKNGDDNYWTLTEALSNANAGDTIILIADVDEDVTISQAPDVKITIDGNNNTMTGTITVDGKSARYETAGLTIKNINFDATNISKDASINLGGKNNTNIRYTSNVTVENCSFSGTYKTNGAEKVGIKTYTGGDHNLVVKGCTATGMHSLVQLNNVEKGLEITDCTITDSKNGISIGNSTGVTIDNCNITADGYGIRANGEDAYTTTVSDCTITAELPIVVRKTTAAYALALEGTNSLTATNEKGFQVIFTTGDDGTYDTPANIFTITGADDLTVFPVYAAQIGDDKFGTLSAAITAAQPNDTIVLLANITEDVTVNKSITIDGKKSDTENYSYTGGISVSGSSSAVTVKNVNFVGGANYAITTNTIKSITVENCTASGYDYGFLYANKSTPTVKVKNVTVNGVNYGFHWVYGTTATLENVTMTNVYYGLYIQNYAGKTVTLKNCNISSIGIWERSGSSGVQTFKFEGSNTVSTLSNSQYAKYVLADDAELTAPEGSAVTASNDAYFVKYVDGTYKSVKAIAQIGDVKYESLAEAFAEGGDIVLLSDVELAKTITVKKDASLDLNGKTISGTCNASQAHMFMVNNGATMTIEDSSAEKTGKITFDGTGTAGWIVDVEGALVLESGTLEMTGDYNIGYAVDVRPNAWGTAYTTPTTFVMNGGKIINTDDGGVRVASTSSETYSNISASFTMNGGEINVARDGVFIQQSNAAWDVLSFTMNNGTITAGLSPVRLYGPAATSYVNGEDCLDITLNGGTLNHTDTESSTAAWIVQDIIRANGGATVDEFMKDSSVTASAAFAEANVAEGYSWVRIGNKYQLQILGGYVFVVDPEETVLVEGDNETFTVDVKVASDKVDTFYSAEYIVKYDATLLTCEEDNNTNDFDETVGIISLETLRYNGKVGESIETLTFTAKKFELTKETEIEVTGSVLATQFDSITGNSVEAGKGTGVVVMKETLEVTVGEGLEGANVAYNGTDYVISVAEGNQGKQNTIKYTINDVENEVVLPAGTNEYTIDGDDIVGNMTFVLTDTFIVTVIGPYVEGYALVLVEGTADGYTYDGHQMFKINRATEGATVNYGGRYGWLVDGRAISGTEEEVLATIKENAYKAITAGGVSKPVETTCDVNSCFVKDGKINFQDVTAAYACQRVDFALTEADMYYFMELYLASDVNCDGIVNVLDTAMISNSYK